MAKESHGINKILKKQHLNHFQQNSSYMEKEESTRIPNCRSKVAKSLRKTGYCTTVPFPFVTKDDEASMILYYATVEVPESNLHLYYKKGRVDDDPNAEERLEEWKNVDSAVMEFVRLFEDITGNEFEPWERENKFQKKPLKFYPIDMDDGVDVRHGGLVLRQLGVAAAHSKLESLVAKFLKVLCSQEIYKYALMEMDLDAPDLPMGMLSNFHLKRCEEVLQEFVEKVKSMKEPGSKAEAVWSDFSQRWFTLMHSTRPFIFRNYQELADHGAAAFESVRDIVVASHIIGHMGDDTLDDTLSDRYKRIGCSISPVDKDSDDYKMILNYLEKKLPNLSNLRTLNRRYQLITSLLWKLMKAPLLMK